MDETRNLLSAVMNATGTTKRLGATMIVHHVCYSFIIDIM